MSSEFSAQQYAMMAKLVRGSQLAGYVIEEQIGAGGMAVVFRARDGMLGRLAALKVLSPVLAADQEFRARFLRESQAVASVEEPHIIPVYGAGEVDGVLYIATKFVSGGDLARVLERAGGGLEPGRAAALREDMPPAVAVPGPTARAASPAGSRPVTRPAAPPPAAGQGGKLPLVSRSAVIATLAAVAALVLLFLLHGLGLGG